MTMKLTKYQQEMLDGKHGEAKKFCMEKLTDFGEAVEATEMVDLVLVLNACPIWSKDRRDPKTARKLAEYDLGHSALYDPIFAMKDAHVADETGTQCGNDPYMCQFDKVGQKGYPWNFELPGKGSFKLDEEMVRDFKAGYDKLMEHGWLPWLSCNPYFNTRIPKMGEYCASSESSAAASFWAPGPIGNPPSTRSTAPIPAACPSTAATSTNIARPSASSSWMTNSATTCRATRTGRLSAPASPRRR